MRARRRFSSVCRARGCQRFHSRFLVKQNTKLALQYTAYSNFNGASSIYDGFGRNASDNNALYLLSWFAF